jgi:predicted CopG family antitoxin
MSSKTLKQIAVDEENYQALKNLGKAGDSFNDVVTEVLEKIGARKE